jgi:hypothetical protein
MELFYGIHEPFDSSYQHKEINDGREIAKLLYFFRKSAHAPGWADMWRDLRDS